MEDLEGDLLADLLIVRPIDYPPPAGTELLDQLETSGKKLPLA